MKITKEKCSYADRYKAIRKPTCGCRVCAVKWERTKAPAITYEGIGIQKLEAPKGTIFKLKRV